METQSSSSHVAVEGNLVIPSDKPPAEFISDIQIDIVILEQKIKPGNTNQTNVVTNVSDLQLFISGVVKFQMQYTAPAPDTGLHSVCFDVHFDDSMGLVDYPTAEETIVIKPVIEKAFFKQLDIRNIYKALLIRLDAAYA
ncbi:MAG: hypothetical protein PHT79_05855 [Syntrophomonadaceae bacterium]|nr:hypothetical protein [Syntrophomonadaceae bacterium]